MRKKVLVIQPIHDAGLALLRARDDVVVEITDERGEAALVEKVRDASGIVVRTAVVSRAIVGAGASLEVVSRHGVGYDAVDVPACTERGIPVTITSGSNAVSVAEHAMYFALALAKNARENDRAPRDGLFEAGRNSMKPIELAGRTLLIVGFGRIGSLVPALARPFGMRVLACDPYVDPARIAAGGAEPVADLRAALAESDVVTVHTPLTDETTGLLGDAELALLRPGAFVINTARGGIVDEAALARALDAGPVAGAGLDVFVGEPTPPRLDHPLFGHARVILSPHCAGVTLESSVRTAEMAARNVLDVFDGRPDPDVVVNREVLATSPA